MPDTAVEAVRDRALWFEPGVDGIRPLVDAIGVVYKPETERASHYFRARLPDQFDAVIHVDTTTALTPLERWSREDADLPETYPTGV